MKVFHVSLIIASTLFIAAQAMEKESADQKPINIVFLGESSKDDAVWNYRVEKMAQAAALYKNVNFSSEFAQGDYDKHVQMIGEAVEKGAHAIIGAFWDKDIYKEAIIKAINKNVYVYGLLSGRPHLSSDIGSDKFNCTEAYWHAYGRELATIVNRNYNSPDILWPTETFKGSYYKEAMEGFGIYYKHRHKHNDYNLECLEIGFNKEEAATTISNYLIQKPNIKLIITSGAIAITAASIAVKKINKSPKDITLIGQVVSPESVISVQEGYMPEGVNLELTNSSYNVIVDILAALKLNAKPRNNPIEIEIITKENIVNKVPKELFPK